MQRTYLKHGDILKFNNRIYTIDSKVGDGATCAVYSAKYKDTMELSHKVNIKECYPYDADISRNGYSLIWESDDEKAECIDKFKRAYEKLMTWQDANETVNVFDIFECNNTVYLVMEPNKKSVTFDEYNPDTLSDILKSVKQLASYVRDYHVKGYLHLDIKPGNFLVVPGQPERISLFDFDTVTSISDIESGKCTYTSYSDGWAAPEQKQGKIYKLCPATDIYAIGAVLFEKIMGRQVNNDDIGYFAEWEFDGELFEDVNPKIKRLLTNIFKKTLAASAKRRYQTADDLIKDLDKAVKIAESEVYLKGDDICCSGCFIGRENELRLIKESFDNKKKAVFLHGFGGIGKTELARKYAELYKKDYDVVLFVKYDKSSTLQEKIIDLNVENLDAEGLEKYKKLISLLDEHTLVIVDNFDVERKRGKELNDLFNSKAHILVSTRTDFSPIYNGDKYIQIEVMKLADSELEQVFFSNAQITSLDKSEKEMLYKIFQLIENHTYATELLAKQMYYSGWSLEFLHNKIKSGFAGLENAENIVVNKDEEINEDDNSLAILRAVYCISNLSDEQKQVLRNIYLLNGFIAVTKDIYKEYCNSDLHINEGYYEWSHYKTYHYYFTPVVPDSSGDIDIINKLASLGWIQIRNDYYTLHPLMVEMVSLDLKPSKENCVKIYEYIEAKLAEFEWCNCNDSADTKTHENDCKLLATFFAFVDFRQEINRVLARKLLRCIIEDAEDIVWKLSKFPCKEVLNKLECIDESLLTDKEKYEIYLVVFLVNMYLCDPFFENYSCYENNTIKFYDKIKTVVLREQKTADFISEIKWLFNRTRSRSKKILHQINIDFPEAIGEFTYEDKLFYDLPITEKDKIDFENRMKKLRSNHKEKSEEETQEEKDIDERCRKINELYKHFSDSDNKLDFAKNLCESSDLEIYESVICLVHFCWNIFTLIRGLNEHSRELVMNTNWQDMESVLDYLEKMQSSDIWDDLYYSYDPERGIFDESDIYCDIDEFWRVELMPLLGRWIDLNECIKNNEGLFYDYEFNAVGSPTAKIWDVARICANLNKCHKVVRYLVEFVVINENDNNFEEREHIDTFEGIVDYANAACEEVDKDSREYGEFLEIAQTFTERINRLTNKNYKLKSEID